MRKIIEGRTYNTDTSKEVGSWSRNAGNFEYTNETLYRNRKGAYFLHGEGGPASKYSRKVDNNSWTGGEAIVPLTIEQALEWAEEHLDADDYEKEFGEVAEAEPQSDLINRERVNLSLDKVTAEKLRQVSADSSVPMSRIIDKLVRDHIK